LYEVDMRLRPSGNQGPVATSWQAFTNYQKTQAWIWEHLAMSRARIVAGPASLGQDVEKFRISLMGRNDIEAVKMALAKMRLRIARIKGAGLAWDIKDGAGRLQDIELVSQLGRLLNGGAQRDVSSGLKACVGSGVLNDAERRAIEDAYKLLWSLRVAAKLLGQPSFDQSTTAGGAARFLKALTGHIEFEALERDLMHKSEQVAEIINRVLPEAQDDQDER
jgi:glutamate-ammonia-ligase adenylyltransferase